MSVTFIIEHKYSKSCSHYLVLHFVALMVGITLTFQIIIASIMCGYSKEDWTELAQMAEVNYFYSQFRLKSNIQFVEGELINMTLAFVLHSCHVD